MDPKPPQPNINESPKKYEEPEYILPDLDKEGFCIGRNWGQIYLYTRQDIVDKVGKEDIIKLAQEHYNIILSKIDIITYKRSLCLVLPPQKIEEGTFPFVPDKTDRRVEELVEKIKNYKETNNL